MKVFYLVLLSLTAAACTPVTQAQRESREYSRADYRNRFVEARQQCLAAGGRLTIRGPGGALDRDGIPLTRVWYTCS